MRRKQWVLGIICMLVGVIIVMGNPAAAQAAGQSDRNAYRAVFDATYYYNAYPDVAAVCGADEDALFNHFVSFGVYEGRSASAAFNPQAYRQRYTDLQEEFGNDMAAYCRHYVAFGRAEGRNAVADGQPSVQIKVTVSKKAAQAASDTTEQKEEKTKTTGQDTDKGEIKKATEETKDEMKETKDDAKGTTEEMKDETKETKDDAKERTGETTVTKTEEKNEPAEDEKAGAVETEKSTGEAKSTEDEIASVQESAAPSVQTGDMAVTAVTEEEEAGPNDAQTVIGTYTTYYEANVSRAVNVELAAQRINGIVVAPDGKFSFSNTILDRTTANGYVEGPIFVKGEKSTGIGGGVCQVSSTLYAAMVDAALPATERHPHSLPVDYLPAGLDATIAGNYMDLKFTNTFEQPLLIEASAEGGKLTVTLILQ